MLMLILTLTLMFEKHELFTKLQTVDYFGSEQMDAIYIITISIQHRYKCNC